MVVVSASLMPPAQHSVNCVIDAKPPTEAKFIFMTAEAVLVLEEISIFTLIVDILMNVNETVKIGRVFFRVNRIHCEVKINFLYVSLTPDTCLSPHVSCHKVTRAMVNSLNLSLIG